MRFLRSLVTVVYTLILIAIGAGLVLLALNLFSPEDITSTLNGIQADPSARLILGIAGAIFILAGLLIANINLGRIQMEKTIAFENPEGQVTVSLSAIEDFVKKSVRQLSEVKELRSRITANKKGINIVCRATIYDDSNIPETTERIQAIVKSKVHDMLGVEETINIKINVVNISSKGKGEKTKPVKEYPDETSRRMPFTGE